MSVLPRTQDLGVWVERFNRLCPVGTRGELIDDNGRIIATAVRGAASVLYHDAVAWFDGINGSCLVERFMPYTQAAPHRGPLTENELACARIIQEWRDARSVSPTMAELAKELGLKSRSGALRLVDKLISKGWAMKGAKQAERSVELTARVPVPVELSDPRELGTIAAEAIEELSRVQEKAKVAEFLSRRLLAALGGADRISVELTEKGHAAATE